MHSPDANDVFSISDDVLSDKLQFVEEVRTLTRALCQSVSRFEISFACQIGSGNWGSVWMCRAKPEHDDGAQNPPRRTKLAVKLVHRTKAVTSPLSEEDKKANDAASKRVKTL
jgi:serine/threonine-protein kinase GIN4